MQSIIILGVLALAAGVYAGHATSYQNIYDHHGESKFEYGVKDLHTGDIKDQWEQRHGDVVKGAYTLKEADGTTRVVEYVADPHHGFNAIVKRIGHAGHEQSYGAGAGFGLGGAGLGGAGLGGAGFGGAGLGGAGLGGGYGGF